MSIISALQTYIKTYTGLTSGAPVWVDYLGSKPEGYSIVPLPGSRVVETYLDGSSLREYPFAFQTAKYTADDLARLESQGFQETIADWLDSQSEAGTLPTLGAKQTALKVEATSWGYLFEQGESATGIYQIQCKLTYEQAL